MDVLDIIKVKIPAENLPSDTLLNLYVAEVGESILTFCNRTDIPDELKFVHANMVIDLITGENRKANPDSQQTVSSIKEGDTQVNFGGSKMTASESSTQEILYNYKSQLLRYRKLGW